MQKGLLSSFLLIALAGALTGCFRQDKVEELVGPTMGSSYSVRYVRSARTPEAAALKREIEAILTRLDREFSTYRPDSDVQTFNDAPAGACQDMPEDVRYLVQVGEQLSTETEGAFDLTIEPLLKVWGFGPRGRVGHTPTTEEISQAQALVGHSHLHIEGHQLCKDIALELDFNSIVAGYAVDLVSAQLEALAVTSYLVEITGELRAQGQKPDGSPWRIAIEAPRENERVPQEIIELNGFSVSTSGDYRNYFEENGQRYSHTLDPHTGAPITHKLAAVTVIDPSALRADGLSTPLMVMGTERGLAFANAHGIAALFVSRREQGQDFIVHKSEAYQRQFPNAEQ